MKKLNTFAFFMILGGMMAACVRPASGTTVKLPTQAGQTNPVSTQSALMKEIIAGTQTAMAMASSGTQAVMPTPLPGVTSIAGTQPASIGATTPVYASPTPKTAAVSATQWPTLTPGPPPIVEPIYLGGSPSNAEARISVIAVVRDWSVTIQTETLFPANNTFTVRMGPYGSYAQNGIIVGFTNSGAGGKFKATYTIPDALRGSDTIHIRLDGENTFWAVAYFDNINYP